MPPIQVLIAEDHALLVDALQMLSGTARLDPQSIRAALGFDAAGYLPKDEDSDELLLAIRRVAEGRRYISADIARLFAPEAPADTPVNKLTASETTVLQLVGEGLTSKEISQRHGRRATTR